MRTLAIDYGTRRIGLAMSDEGGRFATPLEVLAVGSPELAIAPILAIIDREAVQRIVVGLPLNMDNSIGPMAREAIEWARPFAATGKPVLFVDERLSSFIAESRMTDRKRAGVKMTRRQKKDRLDAHAAADFLQAFLDGKLPAIEVTP